MRSSLALRFGELDTIHYPLKTNADDGLEPRESAVRRESFQHRVV
jgi:hypothetical protein